MVEIAADDVIQRAQELLGILAARGEPLPVGVGDGLRPVLAALAAAPPGAARAAMSPFSADAPDGTMIAVLAACLDDPEAWSEPMPDGLLADIARALALRSRSPRAAFGNLAEAYRLSQEYLLAPSCQIRSLGRVYKELFGYRNDGCFVEIGGFDGESYSNTSGLADLGWQGTYVEPVPEFAAACRARHADNRVDVVEAAVGSESGTAEISVAGCLSTLAEAQLDALQGLEWGRDRHRGDIRRVAVITPAELLSRIGTPTPDILVIDVEGYEWPVIRAMDLEMWRPRLVIVESRDYTDAFGPVLRRDSVRMLERLQEHGFAVLKRDGCNVLLVRSSP